MVTQCREKLTGSDRVTAVDALSGADFQLADDVLLGSQSVGPVKLTLKSVWTIHHVCCNYLLLCWRARSALLGGTPSIGPAGLRILDRGSWSVLGKFPR
jgi:hypothetical protein